MGMYACAKFSLCRIVLQVSDTLVMWYLVVEMIWGQEEQCSGQRETS